jgi:hypothetical protein
LGYSHPEITTILRAKFNEDYPSALDPYGNWNFMNNPFASPLDPNREYRTWVPFPLGLFSSEAGMTRRVDR